MQALITAIENKLLDSTIYNDVGGRCYYDTADSNDTPYLVYSIVSGIPDNVFQKTGESVLMQFDLFSALSAGKTQITTMYTDLTSLFDDCSLTITGKNCVQFQRQNLVTIVEDLSALQDGSSICLHWAVDYEIVYQAT
jgi:hypothetical protein